MLVSILIHKETNVGLLERFCLSYPLGMGVLTVQMFLLALMRVPLTLWSVAVPILAEISGLYLWTRKRKIPLTRKISFDLFGEILSPDNHWMKRSVLVILATLVVVKLGSIFAETYLRPIFAWDSFANWSAGAKAFYYSHGLLLDAAPEDFFGKGLLNRNANYPPHNPLMQVWISLWLGQFDEVLVKFWSPVYLLCMSVYLYLFMARETSRLISLGVLALFLSSPLLSVHSIEAYSDMPLSVYMLLALIMFVHVMRGRNGFWPLMGLYSAEALFTKDEAPFFVLPLLASASVFIWQNRERAIASKKEILTLFMCLVVAAPWFIFKFSHGLGFGADYVTRELTFRPEMIWKVVSLLFSSQNFNVFIMFLPLLIVAGWPPSKEFLFLLIPVACYAMFFVLVYSLTVFFSGRLMFNTAIFRNTLTYYPCICLLTVMQMKHIMQDPLLPGGHVNEDHHTLPKTPG
ncbi:MAG: hypothetical protein EHM54_00520 [Nitrospiraceae bacterium]|nr:MAG: hypothetical protein EHM54_00520 [Nitrospiraceae bacterium]